MTREIYCLKCSSEDVKYDESGLLRTQEHIRFYENQIPY